MDDELSKRYETVSLSIAGDKNIDLSSLLIEISAKIFSLTAKIRGRRFLEEFHDSQMAGIHRRLVQVINDFDATQLSTREAGCKRDQCEHAARSILDRQSTFYLTKEDASPP